MSSRTKYFVVSTSTCLTLMLLLGSVLGRGASPDDTLKHIGVFSDVVAHIKSEYVEEPDMKNVTLGALNGLLESIDPFASYLNAEQYKEYLESNKTGKHGDVGLILSKKFGYVGVVGTVANSPAAKAGFSTGDMIETIKGVATRDMPLAYAALLLQGKAGTSVELAVVRVRRPEPQKVTLTRADLSLPPVEGKLLTGQVAYLNIDAIGPQQIKETASLLQKLQKEGAQKVVVDVRNCSVGSPEDGVALANLFLNKGRITYVKGQRVPQQNFDAEPAKAVSTLPLAVLTNRGTAEAAEILAAAVQDNKRGEVVGERTYGNAAQRKSLTLDDGGAIILAVAKYYSPDGKAIQDGVMPKNQVSDPEAQIEYDDNGEPITSGTETTPQQKTENDPVVKKALELLGAKV